MALSMVDKAAERSDKSAWPAEIKAEFEREAKTPIRAWAPPWYRRATGCGYG